MLRGRFFLLLALLGGCSKAPTPRPPTAEEPPVRAPEIPASERESEAPQVRSKVFGERLELWIASPDGPLPLRIAPRAWNDPIVWIKVATPLPADTLVELAPQTMVQSAAIEGGHLRLELRSGPGIDVEQDADVTTRVSIYPHHCVGCEIEDGRCIQWVTMDCGVERTCAGELACEPGCCGDPRSAR